jgi:ligand-binding sensor domain-containing protein/signal transduction histidine kinase
VAQALLKQSMDALAGLPVFAERMAVRLLAVVFVCIPSALAIDPAISTAQYLHTSWTQEEGTSLPGVQALAQTPDGYLWLGTASGLIRFDGMRFVKWEPRPGEKLPGDDVRRLCVASQGGLWIDTTKGVVRMDGGRVIAYPALDGWLHGFAPTMLDDHAGNLWLAGASAADNTLATLRPDGSVKVYGPADGLPDRKTLALFEDSRNDLWLGTHDGLCRWSPGTPAACTLVPNLTIRFIAETGGELIAADGGGHRLIGVSGGKIRTLLAKVGDASLDPLLMTRDRDGNVWVGTAGQGLLRLYGGKHERITRQEGLSSDVINALLEDREGNLWVGTARGVDRLREPKVLHVSTLDGLSSDAVISVAASRAGGVWVGTSGGGLDRLNGGAITHYLMNSGLPSTTALSLFEDAAGLWVGTTGGLAHQSGGRFTEVPAPGGEHMNSVFAIARRGAGDLAIVDGKKGPLSIRDGAAGSLIIPGAEGKHVYQLMEARNGVLWAGYYEGGVTALQGAASRFYGIAQGLAQGPVKAIYEDRAGSVWVGTGGGLSRFRNGAWTTWTTAQGLPDGGVNGIVEDDRGGLWLVTAGSILRLNVANLSAVPDGRASDLAFSQYGQTEGLRLPSSGNMANPRIAKSNDGRLWVCTEDGVAVIDPRRIHGNPVAPPVVIEQLIADGRSLDTGTASPIQFRSREVQLTYTGLSLTVPEGVRFRYRLEGLDSNWTDAGTRRYVTYVNLPPAKYTFRVIASNNEGIWNRAGASLNFAIEPQFYQTKWFLPMCVLLAALAVWAAYRVRVRSLVSRFRLISQERARMTRELHDSLLQGFSGVVFQLEAVSRLFDSDPDSGKRRLVRAIEHADRSLHEARTAIMSMHLPELVDSNLPDALNTAGVRAVEGSSIAFHLAVKGHVRQLPYEVQAALYLVGREAVTNAVNHSEARKISAELAYSARSVALVVQDDGVGFDPEAAKTKKDHRGVLGMHERAAHIGATLAVHSERGHGARIELTAPLKP